MPRAYSTKKLGPRVDPYEVRLRQLTKDELIRECLAVSKAGAVAQNRLAHIRGIFEGPALRDHGVHWQDALDAYLRELGWDLHGSGGRSRAEPRSGKIAMPGGGPYR